MIYLNGFTIPDESAEWNFFVYGTKGTCYNTYYPFQIFPKMEFEKMTFETVTIFYGGNGTGKTTLLNIIAEKLRLTRNAVFNRSSFFERYVSSCRADIEKTIPNASRIITSDDVFDYLIDLRNLNDGIHLKREELFNDYIENRHSNFQFRTMEDYERLKKVNQARSKTKSKYVKANLINNVREYSNGESAFKFFTEKIKENALYLLDEPENSLSPKRQIELAQFIEEAARFYRCQFIISTHSPFLLALPFAKIYNLDLVPVTTSKWTELENVQTYLNNNKPLARRGKICMIDATGIYTAQRAKSIMTEADTDKVFRLWENYENVMDKCAIADLETIRSKDYTLSVNTYIEKTPAPPIDPKKIRAEFYAALKEVRDSEEALMQLLKEGGYIDG